MISETPSIASLTAPPGGGFKGPPLTRFIRAIREGLLLAGGLFLVVLIALLDYWTGPYLSFSLFYVIPVVVCAWWGGFSSGILIALAGSSAWCAVDAHENPLLPAFAQTWNGVARFGILVLSSSLVSRLHAGMLRERLLARTDSLTGAANGRTFYEAVAAETERAQRVSRPLTLAYLDLDNFKQLNDCLGHAVGDAALIRVVHTIRLELRSTDLLARLGGDEFGLLLPETGPEGAASLLKRLHEVLSEQMLLKKWPISFSIGAITFRRPLLDVDMMVQRIDALMYCAKKSGKARIEHAVVEDGREPTLETTQEIEKRATARMLCNQAARVRREGEEGRGDQFATIRNISASGVGLHLETCCAHDTILIVEPLSPGSKALLARVVRTTAEEGGWMHGCELSTRLSEEELHSWLQSHHVTATA